MHSTQCRYPALARLFPLVREKNAMQKNQINMHESHGVIWISGYSASGKTTVGRHVEFLLRQQGMNTIFLDGDELRSIFAGKWGYSRAERIELSLIYFRLCSHLSKQGLVVVVSVVSMFDEVRRWFRQNIDGGMEVFLRVPLDERMRRDRKTKNVYAKIQKDLDMYTEPKDPDLMIDHFGAMTPVAASQAIIEKFSAINARRQADYGRTNHWLEYYQQAPVVRQPSSFAMYCQQKFAKPCRLVDVGCGNGRDSAFFAEMGHLVVGVDKSQAAIDICNKQANHHRASYVCGELSDVGEPTKAGYDIIYSRFSLHAMTPDEEDNMLSTSHALLAAGGMLCIECRSINDPLARRGEVLSPTERIEGHYRRFIELIVLNQKLEALGFDLEESAESSGVAALGDDDPVVVRVLARKR